MSPRFMLPADMKGDLWELDTTPVMIVAAFSSSGRLRLPRVGPELAPKLALLR